MDPLEDKTEWLPEDKPPIFRNWNQMYAFVLIAHVIIITLFYLFTKAYS